MRALRPLARRLKAEEAWVLSFCAWNNRRVREALGKRKARRALVLLPHCVQMARCRAEVQEDLAKCYECGLCPVGDLLPLQLQHAWDTRITNRSHKAYQAAREFQPDLIVAVSCHDRLFKGLAKLPQIPSYVIPLDLPHGMCVDTTFSVPHLMAAMDALVEPRERLEAGDRRVVPLQRGGDRLMSACAKRASGSWAPRLMPYLLHLRPMEWPIMTVHFLLGAVLARGLRLAPGRAFLAWFVFVVLLNGGTLAINSAFDRDEGDIGYLRQPPPPPRYLLQVAISMLAAALVLGFLLPPLFAWSNAACVAMAVLYSVPPARLKARAGWDLLINCLGFGLLTPLAGWGLTGRPLTAWMGAVTAGFAFLFGALYPPTQIYQMDEDRARGDRTLAIVLGESASLGAAAGLAVAAHLWFGWGALRAGRQPLFLAVSLGAWLVVLVPWWARWRRWTPAQHQAGMYRALGAWAVTDASLLALLWPR